MPIETTSGNLQLNIAEMKKALNALSDKQAVFCEGVHGIGKSSIFKQLAKDRNALFIDMRLSQCDYTEIAGYPKDVDGKMVHLNPWWRTQIMEASEQGQDVVLLFDEMNRAHKDVLQTVFQVVLDKEVQGWKFPDNIKVWIYAAGNVGDNYDVNVFDGALNDRFWRFELTPTNDEWIDWAKNSGVHPAVVQFIMKNDLYLDPVDNMGDNDEKQQSRRSWTKFSDVLNNNPDMVNPEDTHMLQIMAAGFVGTKAAPLFAQFVRDEFKQLTAYDILDRFDEMKDMIVARCGKGANDGAANASILVELITDTLEKEKVTAKRKENYKKFLEVVNMDILCLAWQTLQRSTKLISVIRDFGNDNCFRKKIALATANNMG